MTGQKQLNRKNLIEELKKDPGRSAKNIGVSMGCAINSVLSAINRLEASEDPEIKKLMAKRKAHMEGGSHLVRLIKKTPGLGYQKLVNEVRKEAQKDGMHTRDLAGIFNGLTGYYEEWKDTELRETLLKHKNAGGWMPGTADDPIARYAKKIEEELRKDAGNSHKTLSKMLGISEGHLMEVLKKLKESKDPEVMLLLARKEAYANGGGALAEVLRTASGASYQEITGRLSKKTGKIHNIEKIFWTLTAHCKKHHDTEVMGILIAHKKAGGWMP